MSRKELTVDELLNILEDLRIQEDEVIKQLRQARAKENHNKDTAKTRTPFTTPVTTAKPFTVSTIVAPSTVGVRSTTFATVNVGSRVEITNAVKSTRSGQAVTILDKQGVVTGVSNSRVYFTTDNGYNTWRAHKNVRLI
jgi:hypothetical protein